MSESKPPVIGKTIGQVLSETASRYPDHEALVFLQSGYKCTYSELDQQVDAAAKGLIALGMEKGDHLAIWSTNHPEWVMLQFATARIGVVLITINPAYQESELKFVILQSDAKVLALIDRFRSSDYLQILQNVCPESSKCGAGPIESTDFPRLKQVLSLSSDNASGLLGWEEFLQRGRHVTDEQLSQRGKQLSSDDAINIQYTSGTTGFPKGAVLTHQNILLNAWYTGQIQRFEPHDRVCVPVPLYHCFGCVLGTLSAAVHATTMISPHEYFDPTLTLEAIAAEKCTAIYGVPTMFLAQLQDSRFSEFDCSSLRTGIMAGNPCPIELMKRVTNEMGVQEITIAYGLTEASPVITQTHTTDPIEVRVGTIGRPIPDVEVKIIDTDTGVTLEAGHSGELCARGHVVMCGYYNNEQATALAIDKEGWLHSGDLAIRNDDGCYRITGRLKDLIIRGGENISPREIEERLYEHPNIEEVQVVGVPDVKFGEEVLACIKTNGDQELSSEQVQEFCRETLAHFKIPKYVEFLDEFPMTVTGKIQKFKLREWAIKHLGLQDAADVETA
ncbi:MAG TPA: AMP-binding protein [Planctomycetes bacterium]|nr:AMP-binding protein [Planctomycetota bacterium]